MKRGQVVGYTRQGCFSECVLRVLLVAGAALLVQCNPDMPRRPVQGRQGPAPALAQGQQELEQQQQQQQQQSLGDPRLRDPSQGTTPVAGPPQAPKPGTGGSSPKPNAIPVTVTPWFKPESWNLSCAKMTSGGQGLLSSSLCTKRAESGCDVTSQEDLGKAKVLSSVPSGAKIDVAFEVTKSFDRCEGQGGRAGFTYDPADTFPVSFNVQASSWRLKCGRKQTEGKYLHKICLEDSVVPGAPEDFNDLVLVFESDRPLEFSGTSCTDESVFLPKDAGRCT